MRLIRSRKGEVEIDLPRTILLRGSNKLFLVEAILTQRCESLVIGNSCLDYCIDHCHNIR